MRRLGLIIVLGLVGGAQPVTNATVTQQIFPCFMISGEGALTGTVRDCNGR